MVLRPFKGERSILFKYDAKYVVIQMAISHETSIFYKKV